ncbi:hypothetical protein N0V84_007846 [Fusarium piperis]|uniref:Uncharacterized protein n=1 Tax=Fusarium piperis TaxID=1435070 RepID=A0A9W8W9G1_9HYPO|nr:hypothetical protein N0V84_007846 [Fusarium piperis]
MAQQPMSEETKEGIRRMTQGLTDQSTIELLTRAGNQAKYNRWVLKERKKAREEAMARAETEGDAGDHEEEVTRDTEASVPDTTGINEENLTDAGASEMAATDISDGKGKKKVTAKVKDAVARMSKAMNRLSMAKKGAADKSTDDKAKDSGMSSHGNQQQGGDKA